MFRFSANKTTFVFHFAIVVIKLLKKYLIDSQIFVALMGTFLAVFVMMEQNVFHWEMIFVVFITYFNGYLYTKFQASRYFKKVIFGSVFLGILNLLLIVKNIEIDFYKWLIIVVLGLLYNSFFLTKIIRKVPLLKVFYVGLTWAFINAWLILPHFHFPIFIITWLYITALVLPFDIRDMKEDKIVTFPKIIGVQNTKYLAYFLIFLATICSIFYFNFDAVIAFYGSMMVSYIFIYFAENQREDVYFSFGVELCVGLPFLFFILLNYF